MQRQGTFFRQFGSRRLLNAESETIEEKLSVKTSLSVISEEKHSGRSSSRSRHMKHASIEMPSSQNFDRQLQVVVWGDNQNHLLELVGDDLQRTPKDCVCQTQPFLHFYRENAFNNRDLHIREVLRYSDDKKFDEQFRKEFGNSYILVDADPKQRGLLKPSLQLFYVNATGQTERLKIKDEKQFNRLLAPLKNGNRNKIQTINLNQRKIQEIITANTEHSPFTEPDIKADFILICPKKNDPIVNKLLTNPQQYEYKSAPVLFLLPANTLDTDILEKRPDVFFSIFLNEENQNISALCRMPKQKFVESVFQFFNNLEKAYFSVIDPLSLVLEQEGGNRLKV